MIGSDAGIYSHGHEGGITLRVLILIDSFNGSGGIQKSLLSLTKAMQGQPHEIAFATIRAKGKLLHTAEDLSRIFDLRSSDRSLLSDLFLKLLASFVYISNFGISRHMMGFKVICNRLTNYVDVLRSYDPDVVLSTNLTCTMLALTARKSSGHDHKILCAEHVNMRGLISSKYKSKAKIKWATKCLKGAFEEVDGIVAVSQGVADDVIGYFGADPEKVTVIYNAADIEELKTSADAPVEDEWFTDQATPVVVSVGRISEQKDFFTLLEAMALANKVRPCNLAVIGGAEKDKHRKLLEQLNRRAGELGIGDRVRFMGFRRNPSKYIAKANLFVLPSLYEGFGLVLLEALACGCPIVASDCPSGPSEVLEHGRFGDLISPKDPESMAKAILERLEAPVDKASLIRRAEAFPVAECAKQYRQVLEQLHAA